jgi:hypothetical protein
VRPAAGPPTRKTNQGDEATRPAADLDAAVPDQLLEMNEKPDLRE